MGDTDCGRRLIDMLAAGAAGTVGIDTADRPSSDLHIQIFFNIRHNVAGYKRGLPFSRRIKRRDTHQTVYSFF